ncbi:DNA cytosine methyltransferase [Plantibacter cousiniae (nom. nud.)]|uniref:DNA cytosine methyltransferase n=1 Tax=Plantibacter cousiniae (nom. nud.) TaxID=199709 RepID=UPI00338E89BD
MVHSPHAELGGFINVEPDDTRRAAPIRPVAVDLFAGCGGLSLGFHSAGFDVVAALEYDPVHAATHLYNFPDCAVICRDARMVTGDLIVETARHAWERKNPDGVWPGIDTVVGGPPCQGFSTGGRRDPADQRNDLILQFVRLVEEIRPRAFCMENVAGLLESKHRFVREEAIRRFRAAGYKLSGSASTVNVRDFGVPQSRRRVVMLGALTREPVLASKMTPPVTVGAALAGLPRIENYAGLLSSDAVELDDSDFDQLVGSNSSYGRYLSATSSPAPESWDRRLLTGSRRTVHTSDTLGRFARTLPGSVEPKSRLFRLHNDAQARTLRAGSGSERGSHTSPRPIHPEEDRVITVREAARLQSFPDWFRFHSTNWHGHRQVGNSVPPLLARAAADALMDALLLEASPPERLATGDSNLLSLNRTQSAQYFNAPLDEIPRSRERGASVV